jgi:pilus assembly protein CpaC
MQLTSRSVLSCLALLAVLASSLPAQQTVQPAPVQTQIALRQQLKLPVGGRRPVISPNDIPRVLVQDPDIVTVVPRTPRELMVIARKPGQTVIYIWESENTVRRLDTVVYSSTSQLEQLLQQRFPQLPLKVQAVGDEIIVIGQVPTAQVVQQVLQLSRTVVPGVTSKLAVTAPPVIILHTQVLEVSRADTKQAGLLWPKLPHQQPVTVSTTYRASTKVKEGAESIHVGVMDPRGTFNQVVGLLSQKKCAVVVAQPTLTAMPGRTATFRIKDKGAFSAAQTGSWRSLKDKPLGTTIDITPELHSDGSIRLQVHSQLMEVKIDTEIKSQASRFPKLIIRRNDTAALIRPGQTLAILGMPQQRTRSRTVGVPWVTSIPYVGSAFQTTRSNDHEVETLILVRPEIRSSSQADVAGTR